MIAKEQELINGEGQLRGLSHFVQRAAAERRSIHEVEEHLWRSLLRIGRQFLQEFVAAQGQGDVGAQLVLDDGRRLRRMAGTRCKRYLSVFGELQIARVVYAQREAQKYEVVPLDAELKLPESDFSLLLEHWSQAFCASNSFAESREVLSRVLGLAVGVRAQEEMNRRIAREAEEFRQSAPPPAPDEEGEILVVAADCKGVPMVRQEGDPRPADKRLKKGEKKNKKKMAAVAAVYSIARHERTAEEVVNEVGRKTAEERRPQPQHKRVRAEMTQVDEEGERNGKGTVLAWAAAEVAQRDPAQRKPVVCLMDGEKALWKWAKLLLLGAVWILDIFHVLERLWQVAHVFYAEGNQAAKLFVEAQLTALLQGRVGYVIGALKQMRSKHRLRGAQKRVVEQAITYFENNRKQMKYDEYLSAGYPIGSGVAEGACRHLVKDRMERTGMRWREEGAQAMLNVRATYLNGDWENLLQFRVKRNAHRYDSQMTVITEARPCIAMAA